MRNVNGKLTLEVPVAASRTGRVRFPADGLRIALPDIQQNIEAGQTEGTITLEDGLQIHWRFDPT